MVNVGPGTVKLNVKLEEHFIAFEFDGPDGVRARSIISSIGLRGVTANKWSVVGNSPSGSPDALKVSI